MLVLLIDENMWLFCTSFPKNFYSSVCNWKILCIFAKTQKYDHKHDNNLGRCFVGGGTADEVQRRDEEEGRGLVGKSMLLFQFRIFEDVGFGVD